MKNKCLICDEEFDSEELLKKHVDKHLEESILSKQIETIEADTISKSDKRTID